MKPWMDTLIGAISSRHFVDVIAPDIPFCRKRNCRVPGIDSASVHPKDSKRKTTQMKAQIRTLPSRDGILTRSA